jgi:hypothetical protein
MIAEFRIVPEKPLLGKLSVENYATAAREKINLSTCRRAGQ